MTLETLEKAAEAMGSHLIYAIRPAMGNFDEMVTTQAKKAALRIITQTKRSMQLEDQEVSDETTKNQIEDLAHQLKQKLDPRIWREE